MHIYAYKLKLEAMLWHAATLTPELLAGRMADDAMIKEFAPHSSGAHIVSIGLQRDRDSHEEALNELLLAAQELGYTFVEGEITKIADRAIEMAVGLGVGGLGAGSTTENGELAVIAAAIGWVVGLFVGANMEKVEVVYGVQLTNTGWHLTPVPARSGSARPALQAG
jgi:hypothetical protein